MHILLKIFVSGLLLVLLVALGTEVAALHHGPPPDALRLVPPVVVRKSVCAPMPPKVVRPVAQQAALSLRGAAEAIRPVKTRHAH